MERIMLTGISSEKLYELRVKCEEKFSSELKALWAKAYSKEITSKDEMVKELEFLNHSFQCELEDYTTSVWDFTKEDIALVKESDKSLYDIAMTKF